MLDWLIPSRPPTPSEWAVLFWAFVALLIVSGLVAVIASFFAENPKIAVELVKYGARTLTVGVGIGAATWLVRRFVD